MPGGGATALSNVPYNERQTSSSLFSHFHTCLSKTVRLLGFSPSFASGLPLCCIKRSYCRQATEKRLVRSLQDAMQWTGMALIVAGGAITGRRRGCQRLFAPVLRA